MTGFHAPPRPTLAQAIPMVYRILGACIAMAESVPTLNENLRRNRPAIDLVGKHRPDLWDRLADQARRKRAGLQTPTVPARPASAKT